MAKFDTDDDIGKPGKPLKARPFPWKLWLFALVMTAAAGAAGYFAWDYREQVKATAVTRAEDAGKVANAEKTAAECNGKLKTADALKTSLDKCTSDNKELTAQNTKFSTDLHSSDEELKRLREQARDLKDRENAINEIKKQFAEMIGTGSLKVTVRRGTFVISLPAEVLFPSAVAELSDEGKMKVNEIGFTLKKYADRRYLVVGHSDNQPLKSTVYKDNWQLSTARALTVTRQLVTAGMDPKNLIPAGAGEHDPLIDKAKTVKDLARNRRIEIALLPTLAELPPLDDKAPANGSGAGSAAGSGSGSTPPN